MLRNLEGDSLRGAMVAEARASLRHLQAAAAPGGEVAVLQAIGVIMLDRPPNKTQAHVEKLTKLFIAELQDFPVEAIREGAMDVLRDSTIFGFPNLAQFRDKVKARAESIRRAAWRARKVAEYKEPAPLPTPEERAKVKEMLAEFNAQLRGRRPQTA